MRPRHGYPAALHRGLPSRPKSTTREVPRQPNIQQGRTASSPHPPGSSWRALRRRRRRFLAYSSPSRLPDPHHLAVLARPGFVGAASALPAPPGSGCPQLQPPCCDRTVVASFHRHSNNERLTAHTPGEAQEARHERAGHHRPLRPPALGFASTTGAVDDIKAARTHGIPAALTQTGVRCWADKAYQGAGRHHPRPLPRSLGQTLRRPASREHLPRRDPSPRRTGHGHPQDLAAPAQTPLQYDPHHHDRQGHPRPATRSALTRPGSTTQKGPQHRA